MGSWAQKHKPRLTKRFEPLCRIVTLHYQGTNLPFSVERTEPPAHSGSTQTVSHLGSVAVALLTGCFPWREKLLILDFSVAHALKMIGASFWFLSHAETLFRLTVGGAQRRSESTVELYGWCLYWWTCRHGIKQTTKWLLASCSADKSHHKGQHEQRVYRRATNKQTACAVVQWCMGVCACDSAVFILCTEPVIGPLTATGEFLEAGLRRRCSHTVI